MSSSALSAMSPTPRAPLVGREREWAVLRTCLAEALAGRGGLVLIGGEAGIGKTALAEGLCREAATQGALAGVGHCYELAETPPYGPWREVFECAPLDSDLPALPAVLTAGLGGEILASQEAIIARVRGYLGALATRRPLILLLEDLHWADPASLGLLRALGRRLTELPLLLIVTYRAEELGRGHPLYALLPTLVHESRPTRLDVPPLTGHDIGLLVQARYPLRGLEAVRLTTHLHARSQGNPFFATELIRSFEETGVIAQVSGRWRLGALAEARMPALLRQVIDARVARLGGAAEQQLALAAIIGHDIPLALWRAVSEVGAEVVDSAIEQALVARLLEESPDGRGVRFAHALIREALYEGVPLPQRRHWHSRVAEVLLSQVNPDPDVVAAHLQRAGDPRAIDWLLRAGERAQAAYAYITAADRNDAALRLMEEHGAPGDALAWLHLRQGWLRIYSDAAATFAHLEAAIRLASEVGEPVVAACAQISLGTHRCNLGDFGGGLEDMRAGLTTLEAQAIGKDAWAAAVRRIGQAHLLTPRGQLSFNLGVSGYLEEARVEAEEDLASMPLADQGAIVPPLYSAYIGLGLSTAGRGDVASARQAFAAARAASRVTNQHLNIGIPEFFELNLVLLPYLADQRTERTASAAALADAWLPAQDTLPQANLAMVGSMQLLFLEGRWDDVAALRVPVPAVTPIHLFLWWVFGLLAHARGDFAAAWARLREVLPLGLQTIPGTNMIYSTLAFQRLAATLALDAGDPSTAREWIEAHDRWLTWSSVVPGRAEGQLLWARYHRLTGALDQALVSAESALSLASAPRQPLALLATHRLLGELTTAVGRQPEAQAHLESALVHADACAAPYERALTLLARAELHAATADPAAALEDLAAARAICVPLGAAPALARADALAARLPAPGQAERSAITSAASASLGGLSAREVEVLRLVAEGLTDAEVAACLHLSRRTVGTHLASIYTKLNVATRTAAARFASERGLL